MNQNGIELAGPLAFNGNVRGKLSDPDFSVAGFLSHQQL
jgi:hypothetical protein